MHTIAVRNVHQAIPEAAKFILDGFQNGTMVKQGSRNGLVYRCDMPVTTLYTHPKERVIFWKGRNENPFFHFMEGLWMISGRNDVEWITRYNKSFAQFSDDGVTFHGAYGHRWRHHFVRTTHEQPGAMHLPPIPRYHNIDQLEHVTAMLKENHLERRAVLQMWDPLTDLNQNGKDFPCNTSIYVSVNVHGALDITVSCRSNDVVWGAYGANAVHMSMLQEYLAAKVGVPVGRYWQISNNWHCYEDTFPLISHLHDATRTARDQNPYLDMEPFPMVTKDIEVWEQDLAIFMDEGPVIGFRDRFFRQVVAPIHHAWIALNEKDNPNRFTTATEIMAQCKAEDWRLACNAYIQRREFNVK